MAVDPITAGLEAGTAVVHAGMQVQTELNTDAMKAAKVAQEYRHHKDAVNALIILAQDGNDKAFEAIKVLCCCVAILLALVGCTVAPGLVTPKSQPAVPEMLKATPDGAIVTPFWAERYTNLCQRYGDTQVPPMPVPRWIWPTGTNTFLVSWQAVAAFEDMDQHWRQAGKP